MIKYEYSDFVVLGVNNVVRGPSSNIIGHGCVLPVVESSGT